MKRLLLVACLLAGCATTSEPTNVRPVSTSTPWMQTLLVPSRGTPQRALDRARSRLQQAGFRTDLAALMGEASAPDALLLTDDRREPGRCFGRTEVISVKALSEDRTTLLHFACQTATWKEPANGGFCEHTQTVGCPLRGDQAVALMADDALSSL